VRGRGFSAAPVGLAAVGIGNVGWTLGSVPSQRKFTLAQGAAGFASEMLCGGGFLMLLSLCTGERFSWPAQPAALWAWTYLVFFGSLIAFSDDATDACAGAAGSSEATAAGIELPSILERPLLRALLTGAPITA
jgi:hypothetical protein